MMNGQCELPSFSIFSEKQFLAFFKLWSLQQNAGALVTMVYVCM